ncbi:uncharacterized protein LOC114260877 [Camellia sinensis]|uniref:uncharacterized protein LOC114260877 n=1 Tax=Camellia sinensis TaxID=4442 RepID=UPI001036629A|nr:uncharacterized protein LOC114260877 [Camellia sinensis]
MQLYGFMIIVSFSNLSYHSLSFNLENALGSHTKAKHKHSAGQYMDLKRELLSSDWKLYAQSIRGSNGGNKTDRNSFRTTYILQDSVTRLYRSGLFLVSIY